MTMTAEQLAQTIRPDLEMLCSSEELTSERREALARIVEHLTPPNLLALLDELERKDKRIAELEARTVTVKLPHQFKTSMYGTPLYEQCDILAMLADAGINLTVEG